MFSIANLCGLLMAFTSTTRWAGCKDQPNSSAAVLSTPCIHGDSSLICGFNHSFQNLSLFMTLTFTLTVNGKHLLRLLERQELCSSQLFVCSVVTFHISTFLPTHLVGDRVGGGRRGGARLHTTLMNRIIPLKNSATSLGRLDADSKEKKVAREHQQPLG